MAKGSLDAGALRLGQAHAAQHLRRMRQPPAALGLEVGAVRLEDVLAQQVHRAEHLELIPRETELAAREGAPELLVLDEPSARGLGRQTHPAQPQRRRLPLHRADDVLEPPVRLEGPVRLEVVGRHPQARGPLQRARLGTARAVDGKLGPRVKGAGAAQASCEEVGEGRARGRATVGQRGLPEVVQRPRADCFVFT